MAAVISDVDIQGFADRLSGARDRIQERYEANLAAIILLDAQYIRGGAADNRGDLIAAQRDIIAEAGVLVADMTHALEDNPDTPEDDKARVQELIDTAKKMRGRNLRRARREAVQTVFQERFNELQLEYDRTLAIIQQEDTNETLGLGLGHDDAARAAALGAQAANLVAFETFVERANEAVGSLHIEPAPASIATAAGKRAAAQTARDQEQARAQQTLALCDQIEPALQAVLGARTAVDNRANDDNLDDLLTAEQAAIAVLTGLHTQITEALGDMPDGSPAKAHLILQQTRVKRERDEALVHPLIVATAVANTEAQYVQDQIRALGPVELVAQEAALQERLNAAGERVTRQREIIGNLGGNVAAATAGLAGARADAGLSGGTLQTARNDLQAEVNLARPIAALNQAVTAQVNVDLAQIAIINLNAGLHTDVSLIALRAADTALQTAITALTTAIDAAQRDGVTDDVLSLQARPRLGELNTAKARTAAAVTLTTNVLAIRAAIATAGQAIVTSGRVVQEAIHRADPSQAILALVQAQSGFVGAQVAALRDLPAAADPAAVAVENPADAQRALADEIARLNGEEARLGGLLAQALQVAADAVANNRAVVIVAGLDPNALNDQLQELIDRTAGDRRAELQAQRGAIQAAQGHAAGVPDVVNGVAVPGIVAARTAAVEALARLDAAGQAITDVVTAAQATIARRAQETAAAQAAFDGFRNRFTAIDARANAWVQADITNGVKAAIANTANDAAAIQAAQQERISLDQERGTIERDLDRLRGEMDTALGAGGGFDDPHREAERNQLQQLRDNDAHNDSAEFMQRKIGLEQPSKDAQVAIGNDIGNQRRIYTAAKVAFDATIAEIKRLNGDILAARGVEDENIRKRVEQYEILHNQRGIMREIMEEYLRILRNMAIPLAYRIAEAECREELILVGNVISAADDSFRRVGENAELTIQSLFIENRTERTHIENKIEEQANKIKEARAELMNANFALQAARFHGSDISDAQTEVDDAKVALKGEMGALEAIQEEATELLNQINQTPQAVQNALSFESAYLGMVNDLVLTQVHLTAVQFQIQLQQGRIHFAQAMIGAANSEDRLKALIDQEKEGTLAAHERPELEGRANQMAKALAILEDARNQLDSLADEENDAYDEAVAQLAALQAAATAARLSSYAASVGHRIDDQKETQDEFQEKAEKLSKAAEKAYAKNQPLIPFLGASIAEDRETTFFALDDLEDRTPSTVPLIGAFLDDRENKGLATAHEKAAAAIEAVQKLNDSRAPQKRALTTARLSRDQNGIKAASDALSTTSVKAARLRKKAEAAVKEMDERAQALGTLAGNSQQAKVLLVDHQWRMINHESAAVDIARHIDFYSARLVESMDKIYLATTRLAEAKALVPVTAAEEDAKKKSILQAQSELTRLADDAWVYADNVKRQVKAREKLEYKVNQDASEVIDYLEQTLSVVPADAKITATTAATQRVIVALNPAGGKSNADLKDLSVQWDALRATHRRDIQTTAGRLARENMSIKDHRLWAQHEMCRLMEYSPQLIANDPRLFSLYKEAMGVLYPHAEVESAQASVDENMTFFFRNTVAVLPKLSTQDDERLEAFRKGKNTGFYTERLQKAYILRIAKNGLDRNGDVDFAVVPVEKKNGMVNFYVVERDSDAIMPLSEYVKAKAAGLRNPATANEALELITALVDSARKDPRYVGSDVSRKVANEARLGLRAAEEAKVGLDEDLKEQLEASLSSTDDPRLSKGDVSVTAAVDFVDVKRTIKANVLQHSAGVTREVQAAAVTVATVYGNKGGKFEGEADEKACITVDQQPFPKEAQYRGAAGKMYTVEEKLGKLSLVAKSAAAFGGSSKETQRITFAPAGEGLTSAMIAADVDETKSAIATTLGELKQAGCGNSVFFELKDYERNWFGFGTSELRAQKEAECLLEILNNPQGAAIPVFKKHEATAHNTAVWMTFRDLVKANKDGHVDDNCYQTYLNKAFEDDFKDLKDELIEGMYTKTQVNNPKGGDPVIVDNDKLYTKAELKALSVDNPAEAQRIIIAQASKNDNELKKDRAKVKGAGPSGVAIHMGMRPPGRPI